MNSFKPFFTSFHSSPELCQNLTATVETVHELDVNDTVRVYGGMLFPAGENVRDFYTHSSTNSQSFYNEEGRFPSTNNSVHTGSISTSSRRLGSISHLFRWLFHLLLLLSTELSDTECPGRNTIGENDANAEEILHNDYPAGMMDLFGLKIIFL